MKEFPEQCYYNDDNESFKFAPCQLTSDLLDEGPVITKTLMFVMKETYFEMDRKTDKMVPKVRDIGEI